MVMIVDDVSKNFVVQNFYYYQTSVLCLKGVYN